MKYTIVMESYHAFISATPPNHKKKHQGSHQSTLAGEHRWLSRRCGATLQQPVANEQNDAIFEAGKGWGEKVGRKNVAVEFIVAIYIYTQAYTNIYIYVHIRIHMISICMCETLFQTDIFKHVSFLEQEGIIVLGPVGPLG